LCFTKRRRSEHRKRELLLSDLIAQNSVKNVIENIFDINEDDRQKEEIYKDWERTPIRLYINFYGGSVYDVLAAPPLRTSRLKTSHRDVFFTPLTLSGFESRPSKEEKPDHKGQASLLGWATKKIFSAFLRMNSNSCADHAEGVYIINSAGIAYHQNAVLYIIIAKENYAFRLIRYTLRVMIYALRR